MQNSELAQEKAEAKGRNATLVLEMQTLQARYNSLELALAESNALVAKQHITLHPAAQGTEGEKETEQFLSQALGCMMRVENVSKIGYAAAPHILFPSPKDFPGPAIGTCSLVNVVCCVY